MAVVQISAYDEFVEFITSAPTLDAIMRFTLSDETQARMSELLEANRNRRLTDVEADELNEFGRLEHIVRKAKIRAAEKLAQAS
jgi:hypothetical protein